MLRERIIPCLLLRESGFVKTRKFRRPTYIGDAINALRIFNDKETDEIIVLDIDASVQGYAPRQDFIFTIASEVFMPLTYGGGITELKQAEQIISSGVEKIAINSRNQHGLDLIREVSDVYGRQSVVGVVDVSRNFWGTSRVVCKSGRKTLHNDPLAYAKALVDAGAGEILLQAVYRDGTRQGYDQELVKSIANDVEVPVIALGGASSLDDMIEIIHGCGAAAASAGSLFVFHGTLDGVLINMPTEDERQQALRRYFSSGSTT